MAVALEHRTSSTSPDLERMINDTHCHFFSSRFLELLAPDAGGADAIAARLQWDAAGDADRARRSLGRRARSPRRLARGADREHSRATPCRSPRPSRTIRTGSSASSCTTRRRPARTRCSTRALNELQHARGLPVPRDARLSAGRRDRRGRVPRRGVARRRRVRALRRADRRRAQEARAAEPVRSAARRSARAGANRARLSRRCRSSFRISAPATSAKR